MNYTITELVKAMTLEEKASLCSGADMWHTKAIPRLSIESIMMCDGPHGLRKKENPDDFIDINSSVPATCYPCSAALANSWDRELVKKVGQEIGDECKAQGISLLLGPGVNIKRSPLCGRNFEYLSEDPYLTSELASGFIDGVQSRGVGATIKHFAVNNQESRRMTVDAKVDERALREIYLSAFEEAIKKSKPWAVMAAYNKVNGAYSTENRYLLRQILREEWHFDGVVMSDWLAVDEIVNALMAGMELEMPGSYGTGQKKIVTAVKSGALPMHVLDEAVVKLLQLIQASVNNRQKSVPFDIKAHHQFAREMAAECIVLLKNDENILPIQKTKSIAVIGAFAKKPRFQGGGSSHVTPTAVDIPLDEVKKLAQNAKITYAEGYRIDDDEPDTGLISAAKTAAAGAQVTLLFVGLPDRDESEGYDRDDLLLPKNQRVLIDEIAKASENVVVVLQNGSPVEMPWAGRVKGIVEASLGGQAVGGAIADILFGIKNPCAKLAETYPARLQDCPCYINFPGAGNRVEYSEGIFVGYRYYDKTQLRPLFPFGYGLSYTSFDYSDLKLSRDNILDTDVISVSVKIRNSGKTAGKEIVQLYVKSPAENIIWPEKELKGFIKVTLAPGEEKTVSFALDKRSFAYYNTGIKDWHVLSGVYKILIGRSSREILLEKSLKITSTQRIKKIFSRNTTIGELLEDVITAQMFDNFLNYFGPLGQYLKNSTKTECEAVADAPLRTLVTYSHGVITDESLSQFITLLNGTASIL